MTEAMCIDLSLLFFPLLGLESPSILSAGWLFLSVQVIPQIFGLILLCSLAGINSIIFAAINQNVHVICTSESLEFLITHSSSVLVLHIRCPLILRLTYLDIHFLKTQMSTFIL